MCEPSDPRSLGTYLRLLSHHTKGLCFRLHCIEIYQLLGKAVEVVPVLNKEFPCPTLGSSASAASNKRRIVTAVVRETVYRLFRFRSNILDCSQREIKMLL